MNFWLRNLNDSFDYFSLRTLKGPKTASWNRIWMGQKHWETSNHFWLEYNINRSVIITKNEGWLKNSLSKKADLGQ